MTNEKCEFCNKTIKDKKKGSKYCSDTCKQKAYQARKENQNQKEDINTIFYLEDFTSIQGDHWSWYFDGLNEGSDLDIPTYCFLMQHGNPDWNIDQKRDYILGFCKSKNNRFDSVRDSQAFRRFKEEFLSGKFKLISKTK